jgi:hypothetical protein
VTLGTGLDWRYEGLFERCYVYYMGHYAGRYVGLVAGLYYGLHLPNDTLSIALENSVFAYPKKENDIV